jgi:hypothetical protein
MDLEDEFGFLPRELVFRAHSLIAAFHSRHGSGPKFRAGSLLNSANSPYLSRVTRAVVTQGKMMQAALVASVAALAIGIFLSRWALIGVPLMLAVAFVLYKRMGFDLVQIRALVLATEMLAEDFGGWGETFPRARLAAQEWISKSMAQDEERLLPLFIRDDQRDEFARLFKPSSGSVALAEASGPEA